jgi:hypothetical protein
LKTTTHNIAGGGKMKIEHEDTLKKALVEGINIFLGAGFSILAQDENGNNLPTGNELVEELVSKFDCGHLKNLPLDKLCTIIRKKHGVRLDEFLKKRFTVKKFNSAYANLLNLQIHKIFTTNIDDLLSCVFQSDQNYYLNDVRIRGPVFADKRAIDFIPLHGNVSHQYAQFDFTTLDIVSSFDEDRDKWYFFSEALQEKPSLFIGTSINDTGIIKVLDARTSGGRQNTDKWILLFDTEDEYEEYYRALGFKIISADVLELLKYFEQFKNPAIKTTKEIFSLDTSERFPGFALPLPSVVPVRSLIEFYKGAAPIWYDIYEDKLHKTKYYDEIINYINGRLNVIVIGIPASGKTALMMQLAAFSKFKGHKLICDALTVEKADWIIKRLSGEAALIFIDNFSGDVESFKKLMDSSNIRIVGFDRDYSFEITQHFFFDFKGKVINVTDLQKEDCIAIVDKIPPEIRKENIRYEGNPSIYELIEMNVKFPSIKVRFKSVISDLERNNLLLLQFFVMCCYVHSCKTPVSFDMAYAFLREDITNFRDVYELIGQLGKLLKDYNAEELVDTQQDYFVPRSTFVSEAILYQISPQLFKKALLMFHEHVSPARICRYDIFKRRAFDAKRVAAFAFPDYNEGKAFYEKMFFRDNSPFLRQQGALYLQKKGQSQEAFKWIDEARLLCGDKSFTIRNSYAAIIFDANINRESDDPTVRKTLDESMAILDKCYLHDKWKIYHAITFADQAMQYHDKYSDGKSIDYLRLAKKWIVEELSNNSWHRQLRQINIRLSGYDRYLV